MKYAKKFAILLLLRFTLAIESYNRHDEPAAIETRCSSYLSTASELAPDDGTRSIRLKNELSFSGGDWDQDSGSSSPLMPFDDTDSWAWFPPGPEKMVGFDIIDVNPIQHVSNVVHLTGFLTIGIYRNRSLHSHIGLESGFSTKPGFSNLGITFQGFYVENRVERVLCLSGNSEVTSMDLSDYGSRYMLDNLVLVLRYPRIFNLTSRVITGEMTSLNERGSSRYFDRVDITSQLPNFSEYSFSKTIHSRVCNVSLFRDEMIENGAIEFNASNVCKIFHELRSVRFSVSPNVDSEKRLGPFVLNREKKDTHHRQEQFELIFQTIKCEVEDSSVDTAKVSALVRAIPKKTDRETASFRTGISGATMSIEGSWSNNIFCGIGCIEGRCDSQISFYFPRWLSVRQRNIVLGTISSNIGNRSDAFYYSPLTFGFLAQPSSLMNYTMMPCRYNYSKIDFAQQLRDRRNEEFSFIRTIKNSILTYPTTEQISFRSYVLAVRPHYAGRFMVQMEVLSLGPQCSNYGNYIMSGVDDVAIHLKFIDDPHFIYHGNYEIVTDMLFEGLYDNSVGEMHLTGCEVISTLMDCSIEARLEYSPTNTRWFKQPVVNITVTSQRNTTDPLHFTPTMLKSYVIGADDLKDVPFRIIVLSLDIVIVLSQFDYMNKNPNVRTPRISLVMLGIQILGYIVPIMTGSEIALKSNHRHLNTMQYISRFLLFTAISLMLNLFRIVISSRRSTENSPNDITILRVTLTAYIVGFNVFIGPKTMLRCTIESPPWPMMLEMYSGIIQVTFVFPQLFANLVWKNSELPVRRIYIAWFFLSRTIPLYYGIPVPSTTSWEIEDMSKANQEVLVYAGDTLLSAVMYVGFTVIFICRVWRRIARKTTSVLV